ncbi:MAG: UDP-N-acetylmuramoyl-tripeptide--D-alanyl-D-alanine ligase [Candidatus Paceibacterota bacterium]|jgi:UDP-N-acetylmuramoyl-tripeptide--D-alanyl-D-alanine ligase
MAKRLFKTIITKILQAEASLVLKKYHPKIIGITGSVGKTSTKDALVSVLGQNLSVRGSEKSYNSSDFGVALTVLGCHSAWHDLFGWFEIILYGLVLIIFRKPYPEWLILEIGLEHPGEIKQILKWVKIDVAVITLLPEIPVHVEFFKSKDEVIDEKMLLAKTVSTTSQIFLNADDTNSLKFIPDLRGEINTVGFAESADYRALEPAIVYDEASGQTRPTGLSFNLNHHEKSLTVEIGGVVGEHQIYPILTALAVGDKLGLKMIEMIGALDCYQAPAGRLHLIEGIKETMILDDTYNASPAAVSAGLKTLASFKGASRKIAVIGDMLQLGKHTVEAHKAIGYQLAEFCDLVITVGLRAKFIDEALREKKFGERKLKHFENSIEAGEYLQKTIKPGDLIFIKGSQGMRMEKAVEEIMAHPELKAKLLVRQEKEWAEKE